MKALDNNTNTNTSTSTNTSNTSTMSTRRPVTKTLLMVLLQGALHISKSSSFTTPSSSSLPTRRILTTRIQHNNKFTSYSLSSSSLASSEVQEIVLVEQSQEPPIHGAQSIEQEGQHPEEENTEVSTTRATATPPLPPLPHSLQLSPAEYENSRFECDETVEFWLNFQRLELSDARDNIRDVVNVANRFVGKGGDALSYWLRHNARSGYFITNAILGTTASTVHDRIRSLDTENSFTKSLLQSQTLSRIVLETALAYEQDYERICSGKYKLPYDMYNFSQQSNPIYAVQQTGSFIREAVGTLTRRNRGSEEDKQVWIGSNDAKSKLYPKYYQTAFHYQTDGWMSSESANVYDTSTETLFLGRQDSMQRSALIPLVQYAKDVKGRPLKVLEVACGTGRFMTFVRDNLPLDSTFTAIDLSPFYLEKARKNDSQWRSLRKKIEEEKGNNDDIETIRPVTFVQAQAEDLPFDDEEFDVVLCVYLFHELPRDVRAKVASEMNRVTKSDGRCILTDSTQLGDRPSLDDRIGNFEKMNEPYYNDYIGDYLPRHFENVGMESLTKTVCSVSKTLSFRKK